MNNGGAYWYHFVLHNTMHLECREFIRKKDEIEFFPTDSRLHFFPGTNVYENVHYYLCTSTQLHRSGRIFKFFGLTDLCFSGFMKEFTDGTSRFFINKSDEIETSFGERGGSWLLSFILISDVLSVWNCGTRGRSWRSKCPKIQLGFLIVGILDSWIHDCHQCDSVLRTKTSTDERGWAAEM